MKKLQFKMEEDGRAPVVMSTSPVDPDAVKEMLNSGRKTGNKAVYILKVEEPTEKEKAKFYITCERVDNQPGLLLVRGSEISKQQYSKSAEKYEIALDLANKQNRVRSYSIPLSKLILMENVLTK